MFRNPRYPESSKQNCSPSMRGEGVRDSKELSENPETCVRRQIKQLIEILKWTFTA